MFVTDTELFSIIEKLMPEGFSVNKQIEKTITSRSGAIVIEPNVVSIQFRAAESPVRYADGTYSRQYKRVAFIVYSNRGQSGQDAGEKACVELINNMSSLYNKKFETEYGGEVRKVKIINSKLVIDTNHLGITEQGIHRFSLEYKLTYQRSG